MEINMLQALQVESTPSTKEVQLLLYGKAEQNAQAKPGKQGILHPTKTVYQEVLFC